MKTAFALITALVLAMPAIAQHAHKDKGPTGGQMLDVADVHAELIVKGNAVTFNIFDKDGKPVGTKEFSGAVLVGVGADRENVKLEPSGENALKAELKKQVGPGATINVILKTASGKSGQARFKAQ